MAVNLPAVDCHATGNGHVSFRYPGPRRNLSRFLETLSDVPQWAIDGDDIQFDSDSWRALASNCAINLTLAIQSDAFFFHAASVVIGGRGILIAGDKGRGKSTLSLALGARGHAVFGDEMAALRLSSRELLPMRRAASIRTGVRSQAIDERLAQISRSEERYPDGSQRLRVRLSDLFSPEIPESAPLVAIVFLRSFAETPHIETFTPTIADTALLQPLATALWEDGTELTQRFRLLRLLATTRCVHLDAGPVEQTAQQIEQLVEEV